MEECELPRSRRRELLDYRMLRSLIPASRILDLIRWTPLQERGPQLRGACPLHESKSSRPRSFSVNIEKGTFQCFGCGKKGNHLDLYREVTGLDIYEASMQLCQALGIDPPFLQR
jgi:DNA primase